jgi:hypothetical protein
MAAFIQFSTREEFERYTGLFSKLAAGLGFQMAQRLICNFTVMVNWSHEGKTLPSYHPTMALTTGVCRIVMKTMYRADPLPAPQTAVEVYQYADEPIEAPQCALCGVRGLCRAKTMLGGSVRRPGSLAGRN